ncbi:hypothetical protein CC79DRAFT_846460 [Sarocladium strictum]
MPDQLPLIVYTPMILYGYSRLRNPDHCSYNRQLGCRLVHRHTSRRQLPTGTSTASSSASTALPYTNKPSCRLNPSIYAYSHRQPYPFPFNGAQSQASRPIRYTRGHPHPHPVKTPGDTQFAYDEPPSFLLSSTAVPQPPRKRLGYTRFTSPETAGCLFASKTWERPLNGEGRVCQNRGGDSSQPIISIVLTKWRRLQGNTTIPSIDQDARPMNAVPAPSTLMSRLIPALSNPASFDRGASRLDNVDLDRTTEGH